MTLAFLMHPNTVVAGFVVEMGLRGTRGGGRGKEKGGERQGEEKRIICRARRPFFHEAIFPSRELERGREEREERRKIKEALAERSACGAEWKA